MRARESHLAVAGIGAVLVAEAVTAAVGHRDRIPVVAGLVVVFVLAGLRAGLAGRARPESTTGLDGDRAGVLDRWLAHTRSTIEWADGTRGDWDRHLRPMLAREFAQSGGLYTLDEAARARAGAVLFGAELWSWVDPSNAASAVSGVREQPGPGREALAQILDRLERL